MKTILLVEDSRFLRLMNQRTLARAGYIVLTANDGAEALSISQEQIPDLIILDMLLPKVGGLQALRELKQCPVTSHIPIIVLSSLPQANEVRLKKEGAAAYFDKSALRAHQDPDAIVRIVQGIIGEDLRPSRTNCEVSPMQATNGAL